MKCKTMKLAVLNPQVEEILKGLSDLRLIDILEEYESKLYDPYDLSQRTYPKLSYSFKKMESDTSLGLPTCFLLFSKVYPSIELRTYKSSTEFSALILNDVKGLCVLEDEFTEQNGFICNNLSQGTYNGNKLKLELYEYNLWLITEDGFKQLKEAHLAKLEKEKELEASRRSWRQQASRDRAEEIIKRNESRRR